MNDYIKYSGDNLAAASSQLGRLSNTLSDVADMLSAVDTSAEWWSKIGLRTNYGSARESIQAGRKSVTEIRQKTENTISGIRKTQEIFDRVERNAGIGVTGAAQSVYQFSNADTPASQIEVGAAVSGTDKNTVSKFWEFCTKVIGGSSGIGKIIEGITGVITAGDILSLGKGMTKIGQGICTATSDIPKWVKSWKESRTVAESVGTAKEVAEGACTAKWAAGSLGQTFVSTAKETFKSGITKATSWVFSGVLAAYDTIKDAQEDRYASTDDYVVKWASKTATDMLIKTGVKAGVTAAITTGLAAAGIAAGGWVPIVAGAGTAAIVYGGDCLVKWASGGDYSSMSDAVSHGVVVARNATRQAIDTACKGITSMVSTMWSGSIGKLIPAF